LILIGEKDDWLLPDRCVNLQKSIETQGTECEFVLKVYPNATHGYDVEGMNKDESGHRMEYNAEAAEDTNPQTRGFLAWYLKAGEYLGGDRMCPSRTSA
jgi:dienelactone hydrolase